MRVACLLVTHFRAKVELRRQPHWEASPVLIVDRSGRRPLVVDAFPAASHVTAGMPLQEALSRLTNAVVLDSDASYYRREFRKTLSALQGVSDRVEEGELGTAYVCLDGLEGLYRGEAGLVCALLNAVPAYLNPRVGVADAKFPAFVAARTSNTQGATRVPGDVAAFLAPHSIDLLPVSSQVKDDLRRFGLSTIGAVASMGVHALTDRFGPEGRRLWALCNGIDDSPIVPLALEEPVVERISLPFHSSSMGILRIAVDALLRRGYARPEMKDRYAGVATLHCAAPNSQPWEKAVAFKEPVGAWERASALIRDRLEADPPRSPVEDVTLSLSNLTGESGTQLGLFPDLKRDLHRRLVEVERRLRIRMNGKPSLYRVNRVTPWHPAPEMRAVQTPIDPSEGDGIKPVSSPVAVKVREGPEGQPAEVRLGRRWQGVASIEDLWAFDLWWMPEPMNRTYYQVSRDDGGALTLFHDHTDGLWYRQSA